MKDQKKDISKLGLSGYRMVAGEKVKWNPLEYLEVKINDKK